MSQMMMTMNCRKLSVTAVSANNLPDIRRFGKMKVYAMASINGEKSTMKKSNVDKKDSANPEWDFAVDYTLNEASVQAGGAQLVVQLYCARTLLADKYIGEVRVPVKTLFDSAQQNLGAVNEQSYVVSGTHQGRLKIQYSFGDISKEEAPPASAAAAAAASASVGAEPSVVEQALKKVSMAVLVQGFWVFLNDAVGN